MSHPFASLRLRALLVATLAVAGLGGVAASASAEVPASVERVAPSAQYPSGYGAFMYEPQETPSGNAGPGFVAFYSDDDRAGMRTQITNVVGIDSPEGQVQDIVVQAPAGALAAIANAEYCTPEQYNSDTCPQNSLVADTTARSAVPALGGVSVNTPGSVYSLRPPEGSRITSRLGIILRPSVPGASKVFQFLDVRVRDESDYGLEFNLKGLSDEVQLGPGIEVPIEITSLRFTFLAAVTTGKYFSENPTTCEPLPGSATLNSYAAPDFFSTANTTFQVRDCENVPFDPKIAFSTDDQRPMTVGSYTVQQTQAETLTAPDGTERSPANFKKVIPILPEGTALNPASAVGRPACTSEQFGPNGQDDNCPPGSIIGDVAFDSPPVGTLVGNAYQGEQLPDGNIPVFITAKALGVITKLRLLTIPDRRTGQVVNVFDDLPLVPVTSFKFTFRGGPRSVLTTGEGCGVRTGTAEVTPFSGQPAKTVSGSMTLSPDADGVCSTDRASVSSTLTGATRAAGAASSTDVVLQRPDRSALLSDTRVTLPEGLLGKLPLIPRCPEAAAPSGQCPQSSRIGTLTALTGVGPQPAEVTGPVYLAGPVNGSVASLVLFQPAIVGPINAGTVVVRAPLTTDPRNGRLTVQADVPQIVGGIKTFIQRLDINVDKPGFVLNPTGCDLRQMDVAVTTTNNLTATSQSPFQATNCGVLPFSPGLTATVGATSVVPAGTRVPLTVALSQAAGQTNIKKVTVRLPTTLRPDVLALDRTCQRPQLDAGTCSARSTIGQAIASTPVLEAPLGGPVRLAQTGTLPPQQPGVAAPWAVVGLAGQTALRLDGNNRIPPQGGLEASFGTVPDVPVSSFDLSFQGGSTGIFQLRDGLCERPLGSAVLALLSQDGRTTNASVPIDAPACAGRPTLTAGLSGRVTRRPALDLRVRSGAAARGAKPVTKVRVTVPAQLQLAGRGGRVRVSRVPKRTKVTVQRRSARSFDLTVRGRTGVRDVQVRLDRGAVALSRRGRTAMAKRRSIIVEPVARATERGGRTTKLSADLTARR